MRRVAIGAAAVAPIAWLQRNFAATGWGNKPLPPKSKIIVVGAGVVGVSTAHNLSQRGFDVHVLEHSHEICSTSAASWGNAGTLGISSTTIPLSSMPMKIVNALVKSWRAPSPQSGEGVFFDLATLRDSYFYLWGLTYIRSGIGELLREKHSLNELSQSVTFEVAAAEGLTRAADMRVSGRTAVISVATESGPSPATPPPLLSKREPSISCPRAVTCELKEGDAQGSCEAFTKGLADACKRKYRTRFEVGVAVREILVDGNGRCTGVRVLRTDSGAEEVIQADAVVLCNGANVAPLARTAGLYVPVQPLRGYSITAPAKRKSIKDHLTFAPSHLYATRLGSDVRFTCFGEMAPVRSEAGPGEPNEGLAKALRELVELEIPNVADLCEWHKAVAWVGSRPLSPDCRPLTGETRVPGLYLNVGHSFNGWREAVLSARYLGDVLSGEETQEAAVGRQYSPRRFQPLPWTWHDVYRGLGMMFGG